MSRVYGYRWNPEPPHDPSVQWCERRRDELRADWQRISEWITESPLLAFRDACKYTDAKGTVYVQPAVKTGEATLRTLTEGSDAEVLAAVQALREHVNDKITEQAQDDWQDFVCEAQS